MSDILYGLVLQGVDSYLTPESVIPNIAFVNLGSSGWIRLNFPWSSPITKDHRELQSDFRYQMSLYRNGEIKDLPDLPVYMVHISLRYWSQTNTLWVFSRRESITKEWTRRYFLVDKYPDDSGLPVVRQARFYTHRLSQQMQLSAVIEELGHNVHIPRQVALYTSSIRGTLEPDKKGHRKLRRVVLAGADLDRDTSIYSLRYDLDVDAIGFAKRPEEAEVLRLNRSGSVLCSDSELRVKNPLLAQLSSFSSFDIC